MLLSAITIIFIKRLLSKDSMAEVAQKEKQEDIILEPLNYLRVYRICRIENPQGYELIVLSSVENLRTYIEQEAQKRFPEKKFKWDEIEHRFYRALKGRHQFYYEPLTLPKINGILTKNSLEVRASSG